MSYGERTPTISNNSERTHRSMISLSARDDSGTCAGDSSSSNHIYLLARQEQMRRLALAQQKMQAQEMARSPANVQERSVLNNRILSGNNQFRHQAQSISPDYVNRAIGGDRPSVQGMTLAGIASNDMEDGLLGPSSLTSMNSIPIPSLPNFSGVQDRRFNHLNERQGATVGTSLGKSPSSRMITHDEIVRQQYVLKQQQLLLEQQQQELEMARLQHEKEQQMERLKEQHRQQVLLRQHQQALQRSSLPSTPPQLSFLDPPSTIMNKNNGSENHVADMDDNMNLDGSVRSVDFLGTSCRSVDFLGTSLGFSTRSAFGGNHSLLGGGLTGSTPPRFGRFSSLMRNSTNSTSNSVVPTTNMDASMDMTNALRQKSPLSSTCTSGGGTPPTLDTVLGRIEQLEQLERDLALRETVAASRNPLSSLALPPDEASDLMSARPNDSLLSTAPSATNNFALTEAVANRRKQEMLLREQQQRQHQHQLYNGVSRQLIESDSKSLPNRSLANSTAGSVGTGDLFSTMRNSTITNNNRNALMRQQQQQQFTELQQLQQQFRGPAGGGW